MAALTVQTHCVLRFHNFSCLTKQPNFRNPIFSPGDVPLSGEEKGIRLTVSWVGSNGNRTDRPARRSSTRLNARNDEEYENSPGYDKPNASSQEEILAIFRRIQSSISKAEPRQSTTVNPKVSEEDSPAALILKVLGESGKKQGRAKNEEVNSETATRKRSVIKKEPEMRELKLTRLPSNFVRRSPIPSQTMPRVKSVEPEIEMSLAAAGAEDIDRPRLEEMKLTQLKDVAKSRGIKGYSKLRKSDLINLLKS